MSKDFVGEQEQALMVAEYNVSTEAMVVSCEMRYFPRNHYLVWRELRSDQWRLRNTRENIRREIQLYWESKRYHRGEAEDLSQLKKTGNVIICASGPTLDQEGPMLKDWGGDVWCNLSQASTLIYYGRHPTVAHVSDPRQPMEFVQAPWDYEKTVLVVRPEVHPYVLNYWRGKKYYYRVYEPTYDFYTKVLNIAFMETYQDTDGTEKIRHLIPTATSPFGCSLNTMVSHTNYVGYKKIFMVGAGFGDPAGARSRFSDVRWVKSPGRFGRWHWEKKGPSLVNMANAVALQDGLYLDKITLYYRNQLIRPVALDGTQLWTCTKSTIPEELIPHVDLKRVIETGGDCVSLRDPEEVRWQAERFLARRGYYLLAVGGVEIDSKGRYHFGANPSWRFAQMRKWEDELPGIASALDTGATGEHTADISLLREHFTRLTASLAE